MPDQISPRQKEGEYLVCTEEERRILANPCDNTPERMAVLAKHIGEEFLFKQTVSDPDYYPDREFEINYDGIPGLECRGVVKGVDKFFIYFYADDENDETVLEWQVFQDMMTFPIENGEPVMPPPETEEDREEAFREFFRILKEFEAEEALRK